MSEKGACLECALAEAGGQSADGHSLPAPNVGQPLLEPLDLSEELVENGLGGWTALQHRPDRPRRPIAVPQ